MKNYYENQNYNIAFNNCIDVMTELMLKYGFQADDDKHKVLASKDTAEIEKEDNNAA